MQKGADVEGKVESLYTQSCVTKLLAAVSVNVRPSGWGSCSEGENATPVGLARYVSGTWLCLG